MSTVTFFARALLAALALAAPVALFGQAAADPAAQLREALRATTLQLRTAQGDLAVAQAEREQAQADLAALEKRFTALEKQAAADRTAAAANLASLQTQLARKDAENARLADALKRANDATDQANGVAAERAATIATLQQTLVETERAVADLRRRNRTLFEVGTEVLKRYEAFGLGQAIAAREPFTKLARVKLQNEAQDYADALESGREKLPAAPSAE